MPKIHLTPSFAANPPKQNGKAKVDYFDTEIPGFLLEVRSTGKCTFYQRYRDNFGRLKQSRIGPTDSISLEDARTKAKQIRSQTTMGFDPRAEEEKNRNMPTFRQFVSEKYIPFVQVHKRSWDMDKNLLDARILPLWGQKKISEITRDDVQELQSNFLRVGHKPSSVNRYMALVKYIFNLAERWEVIDKSPARHVARIRDNNKKERYLKAEKDRQYLQLSKDERKFTPVGGVKGVYSMKRLGT